MKASNMQGMHSKRSMFSDMSRCAFLVAMFSPTMDIPLTVDAQRLRGYRWQYLPEHPFWNPFFPWGNLSRATSFDTLDPWNRDLLAHLHEFESLTKETEGARSKRDTGIQSEWFVLKRKNVDKEEAFREVEIMKNLKEEGTLQKNLLELVTAYKDEGTDCLYLVLQYCRDNLSKRLKRYRFSHLCTADIAVQCFEALAFMHEKNIAHGDLKPEDILFEGRIGFYVGEDLGNKVKISDFRSAKRIPAGDYSRARSTMKYAAPEEKDLAGDDFCDVNDFKKCDVWSMGILVAEMMLNPFLEDDVRNSEGPTFQKTLKKRLKEFPSTPEEKEFVEKNPGCGISQRAKDFIMEMLQLDPSKRPTAQACLKTALLWSAKEDGTLCGRWYWWEVTKQSLAYVAETCQRRLQPRDEARLFKNCSEAKGWLGCW